MVLYVGVRTRLLDQNAPQDFLYIPQLYEFRTASVQAAGELQSYL